MLYHYMDSSPLHGNSSTLRLDDFAPETVSSFFDSSLRLGLGYTKDSTTEPSSSTSSSAPSGLLA